MNFPAIRDYGGQGLTWSILVETPMGMLPAAISICGYEALLDFLDLVFVESR